MQEVQQNFIFTLDKFKIFQSTGESYQAFCKKYVDYWYNNLILSDTEFRLNCHKNFWYCSYFLNKESNPHINMYERFGFPLYDTVQKLHQERNDGLPEGIDFRDAIIANLSARLGKTRILTIEHVAWIMGVASQKIINKNGKIFLERESKPYKIAIRTAAQGTLKYIQAQIANLVSSPIYKKIFPYFNIVTNNAHQISANKDTILVVFRTSGANLTGSGYNLIIGDDILNPFTLHTKLHETALENTDTVTGRRESTPRTKSLYIEQRLDYKDITSWALKKYTVDGIPLYYRIVMPFAYEKDMEYEIDLKHLPPIPKNSSNLTFADILAKFGYLNGNKIIFKQGEFVSPRFKWQDYMFLKSSVHWKTHYQNEEITEPSGAIFTSRHLQIAKNHFLHKKSLEEIIDSMDKIVIGVDIGLKKDTGGNSKIPDRTAFGVVGFDMMTIKEQIQAKGEIIDHSAFEGGENFFLKRFTVLECTAGVWNPDEIIEEMIRLYMKYKRKLSRFQIERNQGHELLTTVLFEEKFCQEMYKRGYALEHDIKDIIMGHSTTTSKKTRISNLAALYLNGQVRHVVATNELGLDKKSIKSVSDVIQDKEIATTTGLEFEMIHKNRLDELEKDAIGFTPGSRTKSPDLVDSIEFAVNYLERQHVENQKELSTFEKIHKEFVNFKFW